MLTQKAVFQKGGTEATNLVCRKVVMMFAMEGGRAGQFEMVQDIIIRHIWEELILIFGYPILELVG
jgi:hypothetical protein